MKTSTSFSIILVILVAVTSLSNAQDRVPVPAPIPAGLETVEFFSPAVDRNMKFDIVLPEAYYSSEDRYQDVIVEGSLDAAGILQARQLLVQHGADFESVDEFADGG